VRERCAYRGLARRPEGKRALGDLVIGGMILKGSWRNRLEIVSGFGWAPVADCCESGNEPSVSIKCSGYHDWLCKCQLTKNTAPGK
jgi:hypothetical protein